MFFECGFLPFRIHTLTWSHPCLYAGMLSATASLGLILLWDVDGGLIQIDKYLYSSEDYIKVELVLTVTSTSIPLKTTSR